MTATDFVHWTEERKEDGDLDAAILCRKKMPAVSGRKKGRQSCVGIYAGNFGPEKNVGKFGPVKNASNIGLEQNVCKFEPEKNGGKFGPKKKNAGVFGQEKIA